MTPPAEPTSLRYPTFLFFLGAAWKLLLVGKKQHNTKPRSVPENLCIVLILDALTEHPQLRGGTLKKCSPHEYQFLGKPHHQCKNVSFVGFLKEFSSAAISTIAKTPNRKAYIYSVSLCYFWHVDGTVLWLPPEWSPWHYVWLSDRNSAQYATFLYAPSMQSHRPHTGATR